MIRKVTRYQAVCDRCGEKDHEVCYTEQEAIKFAQWARWLFTADEAICRHCVEKEFGPFEERGHPEPPDLSSTCGL